MTGTLTSNHVRAHQDDSKQRSALSIIAQLNYRCGDLAKAAIYEAMMEVPSPTQGFILPLEDTCVFVNDVKQTTDVTKNLQFHIGRQLAKKLYAELNLMDNDF